MDTVLLPFDASGIRIYLRDVAQREVGERKIIESIYRIRSKSHLLLVREIPRNKSMNIKASVIAV